MAKKKSGKVIQMLSPENYIRQKARTLPIYECRINTDWQKSGIANITVARIHSNGNITFGLYLVDLKCLGVKDSFYHFNISKIQYGELLEKFENRLDTEIVSYTLVHNIVFAALEFAEEYGFKPHRDFTSITRFILEEDTDDVELIGIECGVDGKPMYVKGPFETVAQANTIIARLEKTAGPGNYEFINELDADDDFDDEFDDDFFDEMEPIDINFDESIVQKSQTFQLKIAIDNLNNLPVWRRVNVPSYFTFMHMHYVIQTVFGWSNSHLYQFSDNGFESKEIITVLDWNLETDNQKQLEASEVHLSDIFMKEGDTYTYIYDFGDSWEHTITLEKILPEVSRIPELLDGKGACPPEDCGGTSGYENMVKILSDKKHPEYYEYLEWLGLEEDENWDPEVFDLEDTQSLLLKMFTI